MRLHDQYKAFIETIEPHLCEASSRYLKYDEWSLCAWLDSVDDNGMLEISSHHSWRGYPITINCKNLI